MSMENYEISTKHGYINYIIQNSFLTNLKKKEIDIKNYVIFNIIYENLLFTLNEYSKDFLKINVHDHDKSLKDKYNEQKNFYILEKKIRECEFIDCFFNLDICNINIESKSDIDFEMEIDSFYP